MLLTGVYLLHLFWPYLQSLSLDINHAPRTLSQLTVLIKNHRDGLVSHPDVTPLDLDIIEQMKVKLNELYKKWQSIFVWQDGPLVQAMKNGDLFLVDEISLADDSVLERLNSVLEPERKLVGISYISLCTDLIGKGICSQFMQYP